MADGGEADESSDFVEFIYDFYCELCIEGDRNVEAEGFCVDCNEYLCGVCYSSHENTRQTRRHELLDRDQMPKHTPLSAERANKDIATKCTFHASRPVTFYCKLHNVLGCGTCFSTVHRNCTDIESICKKSESILNSKEYADFIQTMNYLHKMSCDLITKSRTKIKESKLCRSDAIKSVKQFRKNIIDTLDRLERDMTAETEIVLIDAEQKTAQVVELCSTTKEAIEKITADVQSLVPSRRLCQVYISMKENNDRIKAMQSKLITAEEAIVIKEFRFEPNNELKELMTSPHALGKFTYDSEEKANVHRPILKKTQHMADIHVSSKGESCHFTGSVVLSSDRLIVVDFANRKINLLDTQSNKLVYKLKISSRPCDVTAISSRHAAVTTCTEHSSKIIFLQISRSKLDVIKEISVDGECRGIAYSADRLVVTYVKPSKVEIMDLRGNVLSKIEGDCGGNRLMFPQYVCVSNDGETLYVSDRRRNEVMKLTWDGVVKAVYRDNRLKDPEKVCVDHLGNVYVCGQRSRNVHMLTADLINNQVIVTQADGLDNAVYTVSHCQETNKLYVGMYNKSKIKVFQLA